MKPVWFFILFTIYTSESIAQAPQYNADPVVGFGYSKVYHLFGGKWWNGEEFRSIDMYSDQNIFTEKRPERIDSLIDLTGLFIVPPYAEAHTHTVGYVQSRINEFLADGVFYAMIMNVHKSSISNNFTWFNRRSGLDVNFTTLGATASDGHPIQIGLRGDATLADVDGDWITIIENEQDIKDKWQSVKTANTDFIKVFLVNSDKYSERHGNADYQSRYRGMDPALMASLVGRAHRDGLRVAAHVRTAYDFDIAVNAGVNIIAHLPGFSMGPFSIEAMADSDRVAEAENPERFEISPSAASRAAALGITVITTVGDIHLGELVDGTDEQRELLEKYVAVRNSTVTKNLRLLRDCGVTLAMGSDAGEGSPVTEALVVHEIGVFTEAEILNMLSENASRLTFPYRSIGRLAEGYEASFLALGGNPTDDISQLRNIRLRFKQGRLLGID